MGDVKDIERLQARQQGLISRRQALAGGMTPTAIAKKLRRGEWVSIHDGVYVGHNGTLTWIERAWAAVLWAEPSALTHQSALRAADGPGRKGRDDETIHVAIARTRRLAAPAGVVSVFHSSAEARSDDLDRDLDNVVEHDELTLRIGYRQVFSDGCATADKVGKVLNRRGWHGIVQACPDCGVLDEAG